MTENRIVSPHARLQSLLAHLGELNPRTRAVLSFSDRNTAEHVIAISADPAGGEVNVTPIWSLDHSNLTDSEIIAWSVTREMN